MKSIRISFITLTCSLLVWASCKPPVSGANYLTLHGFAEGTSYQITYCDSAQRNLQPKIDSLLKAFEHSLSGYDSTSILSRVNNNIPVEVDDYFITLFNRAVEITQQTNGAFDMSGEPLFSAWGFSYKNQIPMDDKKVDSLKQYVGMDKIRLNGRHVAKTNPNVRLGTNAIAKGYSADVAAKFLEDKGIRNYLVEIGGEMCMKGLSARGKAWEVGIDRPTDGNYTPGDDIQVVLSVTDKALATSGNYRRFRIEDGKKLSHTIDPIKGYPVQHNLLSCTVIANDCITADAFATAFMVVGIDSAKRWVKQFPDLEVFFIYDEGGEFKTHATPQMQQRIVRQNKKGQHN